MVDNSGVCKLTDFGTAKRISALVEGEAKYVPSIHGTPHWMAPEILRGEKYDEAADVYSFGMVLW